MFRLTRLHAPAARFASARFSSSHSHGHSGAVALFHGDLAAKVAEIKAAAAKETSDPYKAEAYLRHQLSQLGATYFKVDPEAAKAELEFLEHEAEHATGTANLWLRLSYFVFVPALVLASINTYFVEKAHAEHREHLAHVSDEDWPLDMPYMNMRQKDYFWGDGDKTLFWNPVVNRHVRRD